MLFNVTIHVITYYVFIMTNTKITHLLNQGNVLLFHTRQQKCNQYECQYLVEVISIFLQNRWNRHYWRTFEMTTIQGRNAGCVGGNQSLITTASFTCFTNILSTSSIAEIMFLFVLISSLVGFSDYIWTQNFKSSAK